MVKINKYGINKINIYYLCTTSLAFQYPRKTKCFDAGMVITLNGTDLTTDLN